jgi:hypothetical protein
MAFTIPFAIAPSKLTSIDRIDQTEEAREMLFESDQAAANRALGIILVRMRITEVNHQPIIEVLRNVAAQARDRFRRFALILRGNFVPFLGIETCRYFGRVDQITKEAGQMAPLIARYYLGFRETDIRRRWCRGGFESCAAFAAKSRRRRIVAHAFRAPSPERRAALLAEFYLLGILRPHPEQRMRYVHLWSTE